MKIGNLKLRSELLLLLIGFVSLAPFLNKPLFVDDHVVFQEALDIWDHPLQPYQRHSQSVGWDEGKIPTEFNPPFYFYLIGAWTRLVGPEVWKTHALIMTLSLMGLLAFYRLAKRWTSAPLFAALLYLYTPHFFLTSQSLLIDALLAALVPITVWLWVESGERKNIYLTGAAGLGLALLPLTKYTGVLLWAVCVLLWTKEPASKIRRLAVFSFPIGVLLIWILSTRHLYGQSHLTAAAEGSLHWPRLPDLIVFLCFLAGSTFPMLFSLRYRPGDRKSNIVVSSLVLFSLFAGVNLGLPRAAGLQIGFWTGVALAWFYRSAASLTKGWTLDHVLLLWVVGGCVGLLFARPWVCARYFVILTPPLILISVRLLGRKIPQKAALFFPVVVMTFGLAISDAQLAAVNRKMERNLLKTMATIPPGSRLTYPAAMLTGLKFYLDPNQWEGIPPGTVLREGDYYLTPLRTFPSQLGARLINPHVVQSLAFKAALPFRTLDSKSLASFYGSIWGPLPFSLSFGPLEVYVLVKQGRENTHMAN